MVKSIKQFFNNLLGSKKRTRKNKNPMQKGGYTMFLSDGSKVIAPTQEEAEILRQEGEKKIHDAKYGQRARAHVKEAKLGSHSFRGDVSHKLFDSQEKADADTLKYISVPHKERHNPRAYLNKLRKLSDEMRIDETKRMITHDMKGLDEHGNFTKNAIKSGRINTNDPATHHRKTQIAAILRTLSRSSQLPHSSELTKFLETVKKMPSLEKYRVHANNAREYGQEVSGKDTVDWAKLLAPENKIQLDRLYEMAKDYDFLQYAQQHKLLTDAPKQYTGYKNAQVVEYNSKYNNKGNVVYTKSGFEANNKNTARAREPKQQGHLHTKKRFTHYYNKHGVKHERIQNEINNLELRNHKTIEKQNLMRTQMLEAQKRNQTKQPKSNNNLPKLNNKPNKNQQNNNPNTNLLMSNNENEYNF